MAPDYKDGSQYSQQVDNVDVHQPPAGVMMIM